MARIDRENYAFVFAQRDEVIDSNHPDFEFWSEELHLAEVMASGDLLPSDSPAEVRSEKTSTPSAPRLALNLKQAAEVLSVSEDHFREHIRPDLKVVYSSRRQFVAVKELERWLEEHGRT